MNTWIESSWFVDFVSNMREAVSDARSQVEDHLCRAQTDLFLQSNQLHAQPQTLSEKELITELGKAMTKHRLNGGDMSIFEGVYNILPGMRRIREALLSPDLHQHVKIPPTPMVMVDRRIPANEFWNAINEQVFVIPIDG